MAQEPPPKFSQFDCIRNCLPLRTISACAPFNAGKVVEKSMGAVAVPYLKLHKSPFSPAVLTWNQASPWGSVTVSFNSWAITLAMASAPSFPLGLRVWGEQVPPAWPRGHCVAGSPTNATFISVMPNVPEVWNPQKAVQKP